MKGTLLSATLLLFGTAWAQGVQLFIEDFTAEITIHLNSTMEVKETIKVHFRSPGHGIWRTIPVELPSHTGTRPTQVNIQSVTDERGNPYDILISRRGPDLYLRIGSENIWLQPGERRTYVFYYTVKGAINWFKEGIVSWAPYCELYWNAVGTEWEAPILKSQAIVSFPPLEKNQPARARAFAGPYGSRKFLQVNQVGEQASDSSQGLTLRLERNKLTLQRHTPLQPGEGLTFALNLPYDHIHPPPWWENAGAFILSNLGYSIPLWVLLVMGLFWNRVGRDPKPGPIVAQYEPPDDLTGPEAGVMIDETVHPRDIAAGIFSLAIKGYLRFHISEEKGFLFKTREITFELCEENSNAPLTPFETLLLGYLHVAIGSSRFAHQTEVGRVLGSHLASLQTALYDSLVERGYYPRSPDTVRAYWIVGGLLFVFALGGLAGYLNPTSMLVPSIFGGLLSIPIVLFFGYHMPRRTRKGAEAYQKVLGFAEFIRRAQSQELEFLFEKYPKESAFEKFLPHACAFGCLQDWAQKFAPLTSGPPPWIQSNHGLFAGLPTFGWADFVGLEHTLTNIVTPPRSSGASGGSSGFGGGGFSGGGFGGGGGGGW